MYVIAVLAFCYIATRDLHGNGVYGDDGNPDSAGPAGIIIIK